jgi:S-DNA-T family DNA segregation ATPase FtsK/SpoIIIE
MSSGYVCPQCGLDYDTILPADGVTALRSYPRRYRELMAARDDDDKPDGVIRRRPEPSVWSALEYTAHVADVEDELAGAIARMVREDNPTISDGMDPDQRAADARYNEQDREATLEHLRAACENAAKVVADVPNDAWSKMATFPWGDRDALTMMRNAVHEGYHHLRDVADVLRKVTGRPVDVPDDDEDQ